MLLTASGCGADGETQSPAGPQFTVTIPPLAMIVEPVVDGRASVATLLEPGDSPHTYEPRPSDLRAVQNSEALVFGAPVLDGWAADLPADRRWAMLNMLPPTQRRSLAGGSAHGSHDAQGAHGHGASTTDPHFWTDPLAVQALLPVLVDSLCAADADGCPVYRANADTFATTLQQLDERLRTQLRPIRHAPVMLSQPFFHYFTGRYGPHVVAVVEQSPGKEPSARRIETLVNRARTAHVQAIYSQRQLPVRSARAVAEATDLPIHTLDPLGGVAGRDTYTTFLLHNAEVLLSSLQQE
jgi:ABC-type Zn uptake system ZnuABC Zn-binding protein ZnuA